MLTLWQAGYSVFYHCYRDSMFKSLSLIVSTMRWTQLLALCYRDGHWGTPSSETPQLVSNRAWRWAVFISRPSESAFLTVGWTPVVSASGTITRKHDVTKQEKKRDLTSPLPSFTSVAGYWECRKGQDKQGLFTTIRANMKKLGFLFFCLSIFIYVIQYFIKSILYTSIFILNKDGL